MTIGAGFLCKDGIVLSADTQVSYGVTLKSNEDKLDACIYPWGRVFITGAGDWDYVLMVIGKIKANWDDLKDATVSEQKILQEVEEVLIDVHRNHIDAVAWESPKEVDILAAVDLGKRRQFLIRGSKTSVRMGGRYEFVGNGTYLARYLVDSVLGCDPLPTKEEGVLLAAYMLHVIKKYVPGCGGSSHIGCFDSESRNASFPTISASLIAAFQEFDSSALSLLLSVVDMSKPARKFRKELTAFTTKMKEIHERVGRRGAFEDDDD